MNIFLYIAWLQATAATLGSLFFSEILRFPPCVLCWYQRVFMYPLAFILLVSIYRKDKSIHYYALPLSIAGWLVAFYHNLLYYQIILPTLNCPAGISCTKRIVTWFGFVSIPLLSLAAFTVIIICLILYIRSK